MGVIRLFLALVVAVGHYTYYHGAAGIKFSPYLTLGLSGGPAVIYFYVISGFLISFVLDQKYQDNAAGTYRFYKARFIRIYSLWWPVLAIALVLAAWSGYPGWGDKPIADKVTSILLFGADWRVAFGDYPRVYGGGFPPGTALAWTLGAEMMFYAMAPFLLRSTTAAIFVLLMSVAVRVPLVYVFGFFEPWTYCFFPATVLFFLLGHFARLLHMRLPIDRRFGWALFAASVVFSLCGTGMKFENIYFYLSIVCFAASLPTVFADTKENRLLNFLGDLSYPLYLTHGLLLTYYLQWSVTSWIAPAKMLNFVGLVSKNATVGVVLIAAIITVFFILVAAVTLIAIERPFAALLRKLSAYIEDAVKSRESLRRWTGSGVGRESRATPDLRTENR